jgi:Ribbon-helix-helix protein, copG family
MAVITAKRSELAKRERPQLNVIVSSEMKDRIAQMAADSGQSMGQIVEQLLDRAITYDRMLDAMNTSLQEIKRGQIENAFRAEGYHRVGTPYGIAWLPRDYPIERSRFLAQHEIKQEPKNE